MENPHAQNITTNSTIWNKSSPKKYRYAGTAVRERNKVPIRNELISQLTLSNGILWNIDCWDVKAHRSSQSAKVEQ